MPNLATLKALDALLARQAGQAGEAQRWPLSFVEFCALARVELTPGQLELSRVAFDGGEATKGHTLWGGRGDEDTFVTEVHVAPVFACVAGARSGKTLLGGLRLLHLALTVPLETLAPGELAVCPVVAPDLKTARQTVRFAHGAAERVCPDAITESSADGFTVRRGEHSVRVEALAASAGGKSVRGRSMPGAMLDECAFFRDQSYRVNDAEIFAAIAPRIMPGGQLMVWSTPWAETGLIFEMWKRNYGRIGGDALVAYAPTDVMRRDGPNWKAVEGQIARERMRDPENARREFDAVFMSATAEQFFDSRAIEAAIRDVSGVVEPNVPGVGADFGFRRNSSALCGVRRDRKAYWLTLAEERKPGAAALKPSETIAEFGGLTVAFGAGMIAADAHYRETVVENLGTVGFLDAPTQPAEAFVIARALLHDGFCRIVRTPENAATVDRLVRQLKEVRGRPTSGGGMTILLPSWRTGEHGDIASAWVLALWTAYREVLPEPVTPQTRVEREEAALEQHMQDELAREMQGDEEWDEMGIKTGWG